MHTYRKTEHDDEVLWTVGFCLPNEWHAIADFDAEWKAARYASFLNGGQFPQALSAEMWPRLVGAKSDRMFDLSD